MSDTPMIHRKVEPREPEAEVIPSQEDPALPTGEDVAEAIYQEHRKEEDGSQSTQEADMERQFCGDPHDEDGDRVTPPEVSDEEAEQHRVGIQEAIERGLIVPLPVDDKMDDMVRRVWALKEARSVLQARGLAGSVDHEAVVKVARYILGEEER